MRRSVAHLAVVGSLFAIAGCASDPPVYLNEQEYIRPAGGDERLIGITCAVLDGSKSTAGSGSSGPASSYSIDSMATGDGLQVTVKSEGAVAAQHTYSRDFANSGAASEITVTLGDGSTLRLRIWGSRACDFSSMGDASASVG